MVMEKASRKTPIETAYVSYREMRRRKWAGNLSSAEYQRYFAVRSLRNYTRFWRMHGKETFMEMVNSSLASAKAWVIRWEAFEDWFRLLRPTEEAFSLHNGGVDVNGRGEEVLSNGGRVSWAWRDRYNSDVRAFDSTLSRIMESVDVIREQIELVNDDDVYGSVLEEIIGAGTALGLAPMDEYNSRDDGAVWFIDTETGLHYFALLGRFHPRYSPFSIIGECQPIQRPYWKGHNWTNLFLTGISSGVAAYPEVMRAISDYGLLGHFRYMLSNASTSSPEKIPGL